MQLIDPSVPAAHLENRRAPAIANLEGCTIGLLSNGKQNADTLLEATAAMLQQRFGGTVLKMQYKRNASAPAPGELLTNLSQECDYLLTAAGD